MRTNEKTETRPYDAAEYLDNPELIAHYLANAASDPDPRMLILALNNVAKAVGINNLAEKTGLGRESLYKTLAIDAQPRFSTIRRIAGAFGVALSFVAVEPGTVKLGKAKTPAPAKKSGARRTKASGSAKAVERLERV